MPFSCTFCHCPSQPILSIGYFPFSLGLFVIIRIFLNLKKCSFPNLLTKQSGVNLSYCIFTLDRCNRGLFTCQPGEGGGKPNDDDC